MRAFIVRPFSPNRGIDFDRVQRELIDPALAAANISGDTTKQFVEAGNIRVDMFEQLLLADLVIADISVHNANVFYELGIRHALRARQTVLIRARVTTPRADRTAQDEVPFDLRTDRYLEYDHEQPAATLAELTDALRATHTGERTDSPVFLSLPALAEQDLARFAAVPRDVGEAVEESKAKKDTGQLGLLSAEVEGFPWEMEGWRTVGKALFDLGAWGSAKRTYERIRRQYPLDVDANLRLGTIFQRLGDITSSDHAVKRVLSAPNAERRDIAEAWALAGRNEKSHWLEAWSGLALEQRREAALRSPYLKSAYDGYRKAFSLDLNHFYPGLNALSLATIRLDLIKLLPEVWGEDFDSEDDERVALRRIEGEVADLTGAVDLSLEGAGEGDEWMRLSRADFAFLTAGKPSIAVNAYRSALKGAKPFHARAGKAQLQLFADLGLREDRVRQCLDVFPDTVDEGGQEKRHVVIFTGHRVDEAGRAKPRFPQACVERVREEIRARLDQLKPTYGIAAAASGGDILFHEVCAELGIRSHVCLVMPERLFVNHSVAGSGHDWVDRYWRLLETKGKEGELEILSDSEELPAWLSRKREYSVWQRANLWMLEEALALVPHRFSVMALWNGEAGDGPGGTADLLQRAKDAGATPSPPINPKEICDGV